MPPMVTRSCRRSPPAALLFCHGVRGHDGAKAASWAFSWPPPSLVDRSRMPASNLSKGICIPMTPVGSTENGRFGNMQHLRSHLGRFFHSKQSPPCPVQGIGNAGIDHHCLSVGDSLRSFIPQHRRCLHQIGGKRTCQEYKAPHCRRSLPYPCRF